jgi:RHS repeat-associated protein
MTSIGSNTPTYDANGNVTNDFLNTYAWDSNGRPVTVDTVGVTYDALGRMVEQNKSGTYSEIVYSPLGTKLAIMQGTTLQKAFVSLTGGTAAVYNSSGLAYYRHSDWLGSSRLASTSTRTVYYDGAYGPFGEQYANTGTTDLSFTGMNQDTAANVYDFPAREYGIQGRWPSPDPGGLSTAHVKDPQTWNRYAYVRNSPMALADPTGLDPGDDEGCSSSIIAAYRRAPRPALEEEDGDGSGCAGLGADGGDDSGNDGAIVNCDDCQTTDNTQTADCDTNDPTCTNTQTPESCYDSAGVITNCSDPSTTCWSAANTPCTTTAAPVDTSAPVNTPPNWWNVQPQLPTPPSRGGLTSQQCANLASYEDSAEVLAVAAFLSGAEPVSLAFELAAIGYKYEQTQGGCSNQ